LAVAQIYFYLAPNSEVSVVIKALVRQLHGPREVEHMILLAIASLRPVVNATA
jgi:hypothetical protein